MSTETSCASAMQRRRYLRPTEVANELGIGLETVRRLLRSGKLPGGQIGRQWRVERSQLDDYIRKLAEEPVK